MHATVLILSNGRIYSFPNDHQRHAEDNALRYFRRVLIKQKKRVRIEYLFSGRINKDGELREARPCVDCARLISHFPCIKKVVYSKDSGYYCY